MDEVAGGYFLVGSAARPSYTATTLPETLWTPTSCICDLYPDQWAFTWANSTQSELDAALKALGLGADSAAPLQQWTEQQFDRGNVGAPGVFLRLDTAREFESQFVKPGSEIRLLGVGLPGQFASRFLGEAAPHPTDAPTGVYQAISSGASLAAGGTSLGFEPLGYEYGAFHSFICSSLEEDYVNKLGLCLNEHGRFATLETCAKAVEYTSQEDTGAEPVLWLPWRVVDYSRTRPSAF